MEALSFFWVDLVVGIIILLSVLYGFYRGITREFLALITWVGAMVITYLMFFQTKSWVSSLLSNNEHVQNLIAVVVVFVVCLIILSLLALPLWRPVRKSSFWLIDKFLGMIYGIPRGIVIIALAWIVLAWFTNESQRAAWAENAASLPFIDRTARSILKGAEGLPYRDTQRDWFQRFVGDLESNLGEEIVVNERGTRI